MEIFKKIKKRIRKEVLSDGTVKYYCERTGRFRDNKWRVMTYETGCCVSEDTIEVNAIFDTLEEAEEFMGLRSSKPYVVKSETITLI